MTRLYFAALFSLLMACQDPPKQKAEPPQRPQFTAAELEKGQALYKNTGVRFATGAMAAAMGRSRARSTPGHATFTIPRCTNTAARLRLCRAPILKGALNERGMGMPGYPQIPEGERKAIAAFIVSLQDQN